MPIKICVYKKAILVFVFHMYFYQLHRIIMNITNIVVKSSLNVDINLRYIMLHIKDAKYNPSKFSAICWKDRRIQSSCLLFRNGKILIQGAKTFQQARLRLRQYARIIQTIGYHVTLSPIHIVTITGLADIGSAIDLRNMCMVLSDSCYEPELFNALVYKKNNISYSVFSSGKVVVAGVRHMRLIRQEVMPMLIDISLSVS